MTTCNLDAELRNDTHILKKMLATGGRNDIAGSVDQFLCRYDYEGILGKKELLESMKRICEDIRNGSCHIMCGQPDEAAGLSEKLHKNCSEYIELLQKEESEIPFVGFCYDDRQLITVRDVFAWVRIKNGYVFALSDAGELFDDNLAA